MYIKWNTRTKITNFYIKIVITGIHFILLTKRLYLEDFNTGVSSIIIVH